MMTKAPSPWGHNTTNLLQPRPCRGVCLIRHLRIEDCEEMVRTKKCEHRHMKCEAEYCSKNIRILLEGTPKVQYTWMSTTTYVYYNCEIAESTIIAENREAKIMTSQHTTSKCRAKEFFCQTRDSIRIWDETIIQNCPYSFIQTTNFSKTGNAWVSETNSKFFQITGNKTICSDMEILTAEGLYLTEDERATQLPVTQNDI